MRPAVVRLVESSGRFDRSPASLLRAARRYALRSNFQVHTEVARNDRSSVLGRLSAWAVTHVENPAISGEDEVAILHKRLWWRRVNYRSDQLSSHGIARRNGAKCRSLDALYENRRTKQRVMICAFHLPTWADDEQKAIWMECVERLAQKADRWNRDPDIDAVILVGDWNYNLREVGSRHEMRETFPGATLTWETGRLPSSGTHNRALIDYAVVYGGTITRAELLADDASSDHRPWFCRIVVGGLS